MLGPRFIALVFCSLMCSSGVRAQTNHSEKAVETAAADVAVQGVDSTPLASDSKPHIATAATSESEAAPEPAAAAPAVGEATDPAKAAKPVEVAAPAPPTLTVSINLASQSMTVSENGSVKYSWPISSGTAEFPTPRGTFRPQWTAKMWYSRKYDMAPMPHAVFIHGGVAVHATQHVSRLGSPASHGCIRLAPGNARTFYNLVHRHGLKLTRVAIHGTPKWSAPAVASRKGIKPQQYAAAQQDGGWWFSGPTYYKQPGSAYDTGFVKKPSQAQVRANKQKQFYYRTASGKIVYLEKPPKVVKYDSGW